MPKVTSELGQGHKTLYSQIPLYLSMAPQTKHSAASDLEEKPQTRWEKSHSSFGSAFSEPASGPGSALSTQKRNQPNLPPRNSMQVENGQNSKELGEEGDKGSLSLAWGGQALAQDPFLPGILEAWERAWPSTVCQAPQAPGKEARAAKITSTVLKGSLEAKQAQEVATSGTDVSWRFTREQICSLS